MSLHYRYSQPHASIGTGKNGKLQFNIGAKDSQIPPQLSTLDLLGVARISKAIPTINRRDGWGSQSSAVRISRQSSTSSLDVSRFWQAGWGQPGRLPVPLLSLRVGTKARHKACGNRMNQVGNLC